MGPDIGLYTVQTTTLVGEIMQEAQEKAGAAM